MLGITKYKHITSVLCTIVHNMHGGNNLHIPCIVCTTFATWIIGITVAWRAYCVKPFMAIMMRITVTMWSLLCQNGKHIQTELRLCWLYETFYNFLPYEIPNI